MKKNIVALVMLCSSAIALGMSAPAQADSSKSSIGPAIFIGIDSRFGVSENLSLRPYVSFPAGSATIGTSLTYDFDVSRGNKVQITPFIGGGVAVATGGSRSNTQAYFTGGADFGVTDSVDLRAALDVPLSSNNSSTNVRLGAGFKF
jgi:hypothetical protein